MNLLSLCQADGIELKRRASTHGGEYVGPCPWCGGEDRFHVWPENGRYWCRGCGKKGDDVQYLIDKRDMSFKESWAAAGRGALPDTSTGRAGSRGPSSGGITRAGSAPTQPQWTPKDYPLPGEKWQEQAGKLIEYATGKMDGATWAYLNGRGLNDDTISAARLGWWPIDWYHKRPAWGLPEKIEQGKKRDLWLPAGIVIPSFVNGKVARLRIRRHEAAENRYIVVSGSYMGPMVLGEQEIMVVVESELDGFLIAQDCGDMAGVMALGNAQTRPDTTAAAILQKAKLILVALDADQAGAKEAWLWWLKTFSHARRWPPVDGKDPGEMWQNQVDVRAWVRAGLDE